jgi:hypothetical protein
VNCLCGCGTKLRRAQVELNLLAGEVAIELAVWDRARSLRSPVAAAEIESLLAAGAPLYQQLLGTIHAGDEADPSEREAVSRWLELSRAARQRIGTELPAVPRKRVKLGPEEQKRIDRLHPERSFTGTAPPAAASDPDLEAVLAAALEDVRAGRGEQAERALRRFLSARS